MTHDGIGAPLRRKEDRRFLTGRGRYVPDILRPQQLHAVFLRSPHAHAAKSWRSTKPALASPGVAAVYTAADIAGRLNGVPCAWGIAGKDGKPMKEPPHPPLAQRQGAPCRRSRGDGRRRPRGGGQERGRAGAGRLQACCRRSRRRRCGEARRAAALRRRSRQSLLRLGGRRQSGDRGRLRRGRSRRHDRSRQQPAGAQRDGIARRAGGVRAGDR